MCVLQMDFSEYHFACSIRTTAELFLLTIDNSADELLPGFVL